MSQLQKRWNKLLKLCSAEKLYEGKAEGYLKPGGEVCETRGKKDQKPRRCEARFSQKEREKTNVVNKKIGVRNLKTRSKAVGEHERGARHLYSKTQGGMYEKNHKRSGQKNEDSEPSLHWLKTFWRGVTMKRIHIRDTAGVRKGLDSLQCVSSLNRRYDEVGESRRLQEQKSQSKKNQNQWREKGDQTASYMSITKKKEKGGFHGTVSNRGYTESIKWSNHNQKKEEVNRAKYRENDKHVRWGNDMYRCVEKTKDRKGRGGFIEKGDGGGKKGGRGRVKHHNGWASKTQPNTGGRKQRLEKWGIMKKKQLGKG